MLFNITDITYSLAEPHFKATRWVISESLKFNTANRPAFPPQIQCLRQIQYFYNKKRTLNCRVWVNKINNNILLLNKIKKQKKTILVKARSDKVFLLNSRGWEYSSSVVDTVHFPSDFGIWFQTLSLSLGEYSLFLSPRHSIECPRY